MASLRFGRDSLGRHRGIDGSFLAPPQWHGRQYEILGAKRQSRGLATEKGRPGAPSRDGQAPPPWIAREDSLSPDLGVQPARDQKV